MNSYKQINPQDEICQINLINFVDNNLKVEVKKMRIVLKKGVRIKKILGFIGYFVKDVCLLKTSGDLPSFTNHKSFPRRFSSF
jgi:hypothetical protein